jgi:hypothetical protein
LSGFPCAWKTDLNKTFWNNSKIHWFFWLREIVCFWSNFFFHEKWFANLIIMSIRSLNVSLDLNNVAVILIVSFSLKAVLKMIP